MKLDQETREQENKSNRFENTEKFLHLSGQKSKETKMKACLGDDRGVYSI